MSDLSQEALDLCYAIEKLPRTDQTDSALKMATTLHRKLAEDAVKECPACGYKETATNKQLAILYAKEFGDIPVLPMLERNWINVQNREDVGEIWKEIFRFFEVESEQQLDELFSDFEKKFAAAVRA